MRSVLCMYVVEDKIRLWKKIVLESLRCSMKDSLGDYNEEGKKISRKMELINLMT